MKCLEYVKIIRFKDNEGKQHAYAAKIVLVNGGFKVSDEDLKAIRKIISKIK